MIRNPAVAGRFYPDDKNRLMAFLSGHLSEKSGEKEKARAVICPHAGYVYSGAVAAEALGQVDIPKKVLLLGPSHRAMRHPAALSLSTWRTPLADTPVALELAQAILAESTFFHHNEDAHAFEHSLEVIVPFLQQLQSSLALVPILFSYLPYEMCENLAAHLAKCIRKLNEPVLIVASTDMSHYETRENASRKDQKALEYILNLSPEHLYSYVIGNRVSMCGIIPVVIALLAARLLGVDKARLVRYTDSGEVSGDLQQVVGYAGLILS